MSTTSKPSGRRDRLDRPFAADVLRRARAAAERYHVVLWREDGHWFGRGLERELSWTFGDGRTPGEAVKNTRQGMVLTVASMLEKGHKAPRAKAALPGQRKAG